MAQHSVELAAPTTAPSVALASSEALPTTIVQPAGDGSAALAELRKLLTAAGYDQAHKSTAAEAQLDAHNYLQLLIARQAQLQIEHQQFVAQMGPVLTSTMASVNALWRLQHVDLAQRQEQQRKETYGRGQSRSRAQRRRDALHDMRERSKLSYKRWFETSEVAMALLQADGTLAAANSRFRARRSPEMTEAMLSALTLHKPAWIDDVAMVRLSESIVLCSERADATQTRQPPVRPAQCRPRRVGAIVRTRVDDDEDVGRGNVLPSSESKRAPKQQQPLKLGEPTPLVTAQKSTLDQELQRIAAPKSTAVTKRGRAPAPQVQPTVPPADLSSADTHHKAATLRDRSVRLRR